MNFDRNVMIMKGHLLSATRIPDNNVHAWNECHPQTPVACATREEGGGEGGETAPGNTQCSISQAHSLQNTSQRFINDENFNIFHLLLRMFSFVTSAP